MRVPPIQVYLDTTVPEPMMLAPWEPRGPRVGDEVRYVWDGIAEHEPTPCCQQIIKREMEPYDGRQFTVLTISPKWIDSLCITCGATVSGWDTGGYRFYLGWTTPPKIVLVASVYEVEVVSWREERMDRN